MGAFLMEGLRLEEQLEQLKKQTEDQHVSSTTEKAAKMQAKLNSFQRAVKQWRKEQQVHMPELSLVYETMAEAEEDNNAPPSTRGFQVDTHITKTTLLMPSSLGPEEQATCSNERMNEMEIEL